MGIVKKYIQFDVLVVLLIALHTLKSTNSSATTASFEMEKGGPSAKVRFKLEDVNHYGMLHTYKKNCKGLRTIGQVGARYFVDIDKREGGVVNMIGSKGEQDPLIYELEINAGKIFPALFSQIGPNSKKCTVSLSFLPQKDQQYEIKYFDDYGDCYATISRLELAEDKQIIQRHVNVIQDPKKICAAKTRF